MLTLIGRRLVALPVVILAVTMISFGLSFLSGGPAQQFIGEDWTVQEIEAFKAARGFDRPWIVQYGDQLWNALQGDLGTSYRHNVPAVELVLDRMPTTLILTGWSFVIAIVVAIPLGVYAATHRLKLGDSGSMLGALVMQSAPTFWVGIILILVVGVNLGWLPISGAESWRHFVLPGVTLGLHYAGRAARLVRSSMLEVLHNDYVRTARSKGLSERVVIYRHAFRNGIVPVVAVLGLDLGNMLGGAVVIEAIFALPGVGRLALDSLSTKDLPVIQATLALFTIFIVVVNLLTELVYRALDPRIRFS